MSDKKEYQAVLKALDAVATVESTNNKLTAIAVDTEDEKLRIALQALARVVREKQLNGWKKGRLAGVHESVDRNLNGLVAQIRGYCEGVIASAKPQWQILAERAGWTPPAS